MLLFASTIFLSAFLLFLVQPVIAKQILPWFGGSAAVWTTCMVFFQAVLLAGYAYSDWLINRVQPIKQWAIHAVLVILALAMLPITPGAHLKPSDAEQPTLKILILLAVTIGLPYFVLSTTGPLVQAWFARKFPGANPYRLYALSNVGSLLSLAAYPFFIEPHTTNVQQSTGWSWAFVLFALLIVASGWFARLQSTSPTRISSAAGASASDQLRLSPQEQLLWLVLAACGSGMLLTVTTHVTQNVASVPFMWIIPLMIYLVSFILTFEGRNWYMRSWYLPLTCIFAPLMLAGLQARISKEGVPEWGLMHIEHAAPLYALGLFVTTMFCHGELASRKPGAAHLTRFFLMVSIGGAIGGLLVGVVAPLVFKSYTEFPLLLTLLAVVAIVTAEHRWHSIIASISLLLCMAIFYLSDQRLNDDSVEMNRNFYGTLRVKNSGDPKSSNHSLRLMHGVILHGEQFTNEEFRRLATTYYGANSGVGRAIEILRQPNMNVGLVGMGIGTLAAYGQSGDQYRFYELDPQVVDVAKRRFTYLKDSAAQVTTVLGDARLSLEREAPQKFHVLAVDAFSSDSIPVHLVTREAVKAYERHMRPDGVVAFHISNRYLDLSPVIRQLADAVGMTALRVIDDPDSSNFLYRSDWVLVTKNQQLIKVLLDGQHATLIEPKVDMSAWTDDYNNLLQILK